MIFFNKELFIYFYILKVLFHTKKHHFTFYKNHAKYFTFYCKKNQYSFFVNPRFPGKRGIVNSEFVLRIVSPRN